MSAYPIRSAGPMPPFARPSVIFDFAIGGHADLVDWWTIAPDFVARTGEAIDTVASRKLAGADHYGGHAMAKVVAGPDYLPERIGGRPAAGFASAQFERLEAAGVLPAGSFSLSAVFDAPATATIRTLLGSQNGTGRFTAYADQIATADYLVVTAGTAGSAATVSLPRPLRPVHAIFSWDETGHELAMSLDGGAWTTDAAPAATVTQGDLAIGAYAGQAGTFDGVVADVQLWGVALHRDANAAALDLVRRYGRSAYGIG